MANKKTVEESSGRLSFRMEEGFGRVDKQIESLAIAVNEGFNGVQKQFRV